MQWQAQVSNHQVSEEHLNHRQTNVSQLWMYRQSQFNMSSTAVQSHAVNHSTAGRLTQCVEKCSDEQLSLVLCSLTPALLQWHQNLRGTGFTASSETFTHSFALFKLQINLPNRDKENVDVDYFKTSNSRFHNVLQCSGIAINFIREYLIHYYIKEVCFLKESMIFLMFAEFSSRGIKNCLGLHCIGMINDT